MQTHHTALITGGGRGLGKDMALNLARNGVDIILTYHSNRAKADEVVKEIESLGRKAVALPLDVRNSASFSDFFSEAEAWLAREKGVSTFDFLINNAGTGIYLPFSEITEAQFDDLMNVHFRGVYFLTQKSLPYLNDGGRIINISSGLARFTLPGSSAYASMKGAIEVFTRYLAKELGSRGITANVIAPGPVGTDFGNGRNRDNEEIRTRITGLTALGRVGEPEDIGGIVAFLCSEEARWINGQRIEASGGMLL